MRYQFTKTGKRYNGNTVYKSTYYPVILPNPDDIYIITNESDYLDSLAYKYYGSESFWWVIARANNVGNGRLSVKAGMQLRIPRNITKIIQDLKTLNN